MFDALGRPEQEPGAGVLQLPACALETIGTAELADHLTEQFVEGAPSSASPTGRELIRVSFDATQRCADQLGIPRREAAP